MEECKLCHGKGIIGTFVTEPCCCKGRKLQIPTADQAGSILAKMELQVIWDDSNNIPCIVRDIEDTSHSESEITGEPIYWLKDFTGKKGEITLMNNAGLACDEVLIKRRAELERAIKEIKDV